MPSNTANPLRQFFRQPSIFLKLPTKGLFWPEGSLNMPENGEIPIFPMTAIDEITYRTPDALFNGQAVVSVIQSCAPNIEDAWSAPGIDINSLLVAIRIASYGHDLDFTTTCPNCNTEDDLTVDLRAVLDQIQTGNYEQPLKQGDLEIMFRPITYREQNETNLAQFEEQRLIQSIPESDMDEKTKLQKLNEAMARITKITVQALKHSIMFVKTPQAMVTEPEYIEEFLINCDRVLFNKIRDRVIELRSASDFKPVQLECKNCGHKYEQGINLDAVSFFAPAS